ncbi:nucleoside 2-deoxyribosyltransferase [Hutsoniella sourekii]|uniref:nucleoside 2-deoxyribosyltransferase n=1 Tax=Hutsoniella sourekii TaxID=87650 RepID=UPI000551EF70|nr:nucleoside 2-deoxyribosyltransferase [Hutsoniella sourekii]
MKTEPFKIYLAAPLFAESERFYNQVLENELLARFGSQIDLFVPQNQGEINDKSNYADSKMIAELDTEAVLESKLLIAVLDGLAIDPGVASEIGIAYQAGIPIVGLYTDSRQAGYDNPKKLEALSELAESQFSYANLYTVGLIKLNGTVASSIEEMLEAVKSYVK